MRHDAFYMARALELARRGLYTTHPNPRVGCVLVRDGVIIGEGWHKQAGQAHAEIEALRTVSTAQGATAYVSLEPCSHYGKTPPCCDALIQAGVARVVVALQDPNPLVAGGGIARLQAAGIEVVCGVLQEDAAQLNRGFIQRMTAQRPFVRSKLAMSLDGRTAMANGDSKWITSPQARADVHKLRAESSAILTGINTVLADDPALTARVDFPVLQPIRVVLDSNLSMPLTAQLRQTQNARSMLLTCCDNRQKQHDLQQAGFEIYRLPDKNGRLDLAAVMTFLAQEQQINELLIEAGAILNGALLSEGVVDEWLIYMATCVLGDQGKGLFVMPNMQTMNDKKTVQLRDVRQIGADVKLTLTPV